MLPTFPGSFPNEREELFLELLFCEPENFLQLWKKWKEQTIFDNIDYATLRLLPLLYLRLSKFGVRDELEGRIKGVYRKVWFKNHLLLDAVAKVISLLKKHEIPVVLFKGVPLLLEAYKDPGARFLGDADVIISPEHVPTVFSLMEKAGFTYQGAVFPLPKINPVQALIMFDKEVTFKDEKGNEIDIHWKLFDTPVTFGYKQVESAMSYEEVASRVVPMVVCGEECQVFSTEDLLLHVIAHGAVFNEYRPIRWVVDAVYIVQNLIVRWDVLLELVKKYHFEIEAQIAFRYLVEKKYIDVPRSFFDTLNSFSVEKKSIQRYYKISDKPAMAFLGTLPVIWKVFWRFEAVGNLFSDLGSFIGYVGRVYKIKTVSDFFIFIFDKCKKRLKLR